MGCKEQLGHNKMIVQIVREEVRHAFKKSYFIFFFCFKALEQMFMTVNWFFMPVLIHLKNE